MKPSIDTLKQLMPNAGHLFLSDFVENLDPRYFQSFSIEEQLEHLQELDTLSSQNPVKVVWKMLPNKRLSCTILTYNYDGSFFLIAGALSASGFNILKGEGFTYRHLELSPLKIRRTLTLIKRQSLRRRFVIDSFEGELTSPLSIAKWAKTLESNLHSLFSAFESKDDKRSKKEKEKLNLRVAESIQRISQSETEPSHYPVKVEHNKTSDTVTRIEITGEDTPFFLYSLVLALEAYPVSIDYIKIDTKDGIVEDVIELTDKKGEPLQSEEFINQLIISIMLTKQFTAHITNAPNPYNAISRFREVIKYGQLSEQMLDPKALKDFARLLGTSDYLWEDILRTQYESLTPVIAQSNTYNETKESLSKRLKSELEKASSFEEKFRAINTFKDNESFKADFSHILGSMSLVRFSKTLTGIAEIVVTELGKCVYAHCVEKYGEPMAVGGFKAEYAIFGLGKFGGASLGYASDIELLFVYSDSGYTNGERSVSNAEFFEDFVKEFENAVVSKKDGIFELDLRLRPHGAKGPRAASLESFIRYYGHDNECHFYEKIALVRLRGICGSKKLSKHVEHLRDTYVYEMPEFDISELWNLRKKQFEEKVKPLTFNAKFSAGALVDLEYAVQALQVMYGRKYTYLRTPKIEPALRALNKAGVLNLLERQGLVKAYLFFRNLINGLRMLRGSAKDLLLPPKYSAELTHLARRIGLSSTQDMSADQQLILDFAEYTAIVRRFVKTQFSVDSLATQRVGNVIDIILNLDVSSEYASSILEKKGFENIDQAIRNIRSISKQGDVSTVSRVLLLAIEMISQFSDSDMALNNFERFLSQRNTFEADMESFLKRPKSLEMCIGIFSTSQFLSDTLIQNPQYFEWCTNINEIVETKSRLAFHDDISSALIDISDGDAWRSEIRNMRRREILRVALRDLMLNVTLRSITKELSYLAEAIISAALNHAWQEMRASFDLDLVTKCEEDFCVLALGKLGASELNYSSDIDLIAVLDDHWVSQEDKKSVADIIEAVLKKFLSDLTEYTKDGFVYRVDFNLRPYGSVGELFSSQNALIQYYLESASAWEIQALIKARPVAGCWPIGFDVVYEAYHKARTRFSLEEYKTYIKSSRKEAIRRSGLSVTSGLDIKNGEGGIRDIEFLVQGIQVASSDESTSNVRATLDALSMLSDKKILKKKHSKGLRDCYLFYRRLEHMLQLHQDRQTHALPKQERQLSVLSKRMLGNSATKSDLMKEIEACSKNVMSIRDMYFEKGDENE